jgi:protease IV
MDTVEQFHEVVSTEREIPIEEVRKFGDGRIFNGRQALAYKVIDEVGSLDTAIRAAMELGSIQEGEEKVKRLPCEVSFVERIERIIPGSRLGKIATSFLPDPKLCNTPLWLLPR